MGSKYRGYNYNRGPSREERTRIHPVWRGIGFVFMILIPFLSYAAAEVLLQSNAKNNWFPLPVDLLAKPGQFLYAFIPDPLLYIKILITLVFVAVIFAVFTMVSFVIISTFGYTDTRNDPYYVPPVTRRRRRS
jgi:hypothetical protein